ncbi:MAG: M48 family metalloprotease [Litorivicinus sp.]
MLLRCLAFLAIFAPHAVAYNEQTIGEQVTRSLYASPQRVDDPILLSAASRLLTPIHQASSLREQPITLVLLRNPELNAFAAPGGVMGLHTGLFSLAQSSDQVASVIAHELAHISQRHFARRMNNNSKIQAAYLAGAIAAIVAGVAGDPTLGTAALSTTQAAAIDQALAYSREHEREADRVGLQLLEQAGFDGRGMANMFETMLASQRLSSQPLAYLSSHPLSSERVADSRGRAGAGGNKTRKISPSEFDWWQRLASDSAPEDSMEQILSQTQPMSRLRYQREVRYWIRQGEWEQAQVRLDEGLLGYPRDYALILYQARIAAQQRPQNAFRHFETAAQQHPYFAQPYIEARELARQLNWQPEFYYYGGWAAQRSGDPQAAQQHWAEVAKMDTPLAGPARALLNLEN